MVHRLLCTYPAAAAAPDARGRLPLHLAFHEQGNIGPKGFEALLKAHPAAAMARDHSGRTSLHYACMSSSLKGSALRPGSAALPVPRTGSRRKSDTSDSVVALAAAAPKAAVVDAQTHRRRRSSVVRGPFHFSHSWRRRSCGKLV